MSISKIIAISGVQCSGKTTLLDRISGNVHKCREVVREIKKRYNVNINDTGTIETQLYVVTAHLANLQDTQRDPETIVVTDRCLLDCMAYTEYLKRHDQVPDCIYQTVKNIFENHISDYHKIFYTNPHEVFLVEDGTRSTNSDFRNEMIDIFEMYNKYAKDNLVLVKGTVEERLQIINNTLKVDICNL